MDEVGYSPIMENTARKQSTKEPLFVETGMPHWLLPAKQTKEPPFSEHAWYLILDQMCTGKHLTDILRDTPGVPGERYYGRVLAWIMKDENRKNEYYEAQEIGTEMMTERMISIADGSADIMEDVQRSTLRVNTYKWVIAARNRNRFGDKKQIEQTVNVNIAEAMEKADRRVIDIKAELLPDGS